jgi:hypothetical protein
MSYIIGVSSGAFGAAATEERPQLLGLFKKAQYCVTQGVQFVQLDLESISELDEPNLKEKMKKDIEEKLHVMFGIHSETRAFGVEAAELDSAIGTEYHRAQKRLIEILKKAGEIGSKYVLIHSSESDPFPLLSLRTQPTELVDFHGNSLRDFLEKESWLLDWIMGEGEWKGKEGGQFIWVEILQRSLKEYLEMEKEGRIRAYRMRYEKEPPAEWIEKEMEEERKSLRRYFMDIVSSRSLHYGPERWAYYLIAKWMEKNNDSLWKKIVGVNIKFFAKRDGKSEEEWLAERNIKSFSIDEKEFREFHEIWVPAVSAKYIWGHLNPKDGEDPKKIIEKYNMPLVFESPMGGRGIEDWLRFYNPAHIYCLVEEIGPKYVQLALDLEHMLSIRVDPEIVIDILPEDAGKFVKVIHVGFPSVLAPAHVPVALGSEEQLYLYKIYYKLRKKGFGLDKNQDHFILFERGPFPIQQTIIALRKITEFLEKDIKPEDLIKYPEFFGIATGEIASEERQLAAIREHAFDPLKGLMTVPEEEHGFLGRAAIEKGKAEEWRREKYR